LQAFAQRRHVAVVVVHHLRKANGEDAFDTISGTFGLSGVADTLIVLKREGGRDAGKAALVVTGRDTGDMTIPALFDKECCRWRATDASTAPLTGRKKLVADALAEAGPEGMSPSAIAAAVGLSDKNVSNVLRDMKFDGEAQKIGHGRWVLTGWREVPEDE
jgi:hypothetical protein